MNPFYWILRIICRLGLQIYFKKVEVVGAERLDSTRPMLIAMNHPSSFLEACVMACWMKFPLHFIVRGDVFHPVFRWFFKWTNQIPIYRFRDGFSNLRNNSKTFERCYEELAAGAKIVIFAEGSTKWVKQLRPLQRGTARIAIGALEKYPGLDLDIVPVGINFEDIFRFRSTCVIKVGEAFSASQFKGEKAQVAEKITRNLQKEMESCVLHLEDREDELVFNLTSDYLGYFLNPARHFQDQMELAQGINQNESESLQDSARALSALSKEEGLLSMNPEVRAHEHSGLDHLVHLAYTISAALFDGPAILASWWSSKLSRHPSFIIPIRLGIAAILYLITLSLCFGLLIWGTGLYSILYFSLICLFLYLHVRLYDLNFKVEMSGKWVRLQENRQFLSYLGKLLKS